MKKGNITFLLGAGASTPFIKNTEGKSLTTSYLTGSLFNSELWDIILEKFQKYKLNSRKKQALMQIDKNDVLFVLKRILDRISVKNEPNFENILYFLDKVSLNLHNNDEWLDGILPDFWDESEVNIKKKAHSNTHRQGWKYVPYLAREVLIKAILNIWDKENKVIRKAIIFNQGFYERLTKKCTGLNIYSLNYDPLIYETAKNIDDVNFRFKGANIGFNTEEFLRANKIVAFLHGHVGFCPFGGNKTFFDDDYHRAQEKRIRNIFLSDNSQTRFFDIGMKGMHFSTFFVSGLDKMDAFYSNPFACYMHRFSKDIFESDYIIVIGVSLDDNHLNLFLKNTLAYSNKKIIFVTKKEAKKGKKIHEQDFYENVQKSWYISGDSLVLPLDSSHKTLPKHLNQLNHNLINNGYGMITLNVYMFIKGVEEFYKVSDIEQLLNDISDKQKAL